HVRARPPRGGSGASELAAGEAAVSAGNEPARRLCRRGRARGKHQASRLRCRRGLDCHQLRAPDASRVRPEQDICSNPPEGPDIRQSIALGAFLLRLFSAEGRPTEARARDDGSGPRQPSLDGVAFRLRPEILDRLPLELELTGGALARARLGLPRHQRLLFAASESRNLRRIPASIAYARATAVVLSR